MQKSLADSTKAWNSGSGCMKVLSETLSKCHEDNAQVLNLIKKELVPNCKHPKKMRDKDPNGKWYCMKCNSEL